MLEGMDRRRSPPVSGRMPMTEENERYVAVVRAFLREAAE
jgi:hypothetical protein